MQRTPNRLPPLRRVQCLRPSRIHACHQNQTQPGDHPAHSLHSISQLCHRPRYTNWSHQSNLPRPLTLRYPFRMSNQLWSDVDTYIASHLLPPDPALDQALHSNAAAGLPSIDVAPNQGKLLHLLARIQQAGRILEIGTLGGYSTIWLARALSASGRLISLEVDPHHAEVARSNVARAGLSSLVNIRVGPALDSLAQLLREDTPPFDLIFIDADKPNNPAYLDFAIKLSRPGTVIIVDNVIREGDILDANHPDPRVHGSRRLFESLAANPRLDSTALQTVGSKGHDGFTLAIVK
jgi:predicted O-methyltransferase YrrM